MSLDKAIKHGKEKRKAYRGSKIFDPSCRNGTCPSCKSNKTHKNRKREMTAIDKEELYKSIFFDQDCEPITEKEWADSLLDLSKIDIKKDNVGPYFINTIWMGVNHQFFPNGAPLIFVTMIFCEDKKDELYHEMQSYTYKEQAIEGHDEMVQRCMVKLGMHSE